MSEQISTWSQRAAVRDLLLIFCTLANVCSLWHGISWTSKCIIFISSPQLILEETVMSSALPFVKSGKLQVLSIYICSLKGSIKARFVFSPLSSQCIQQIGAFCCYSSVYNRILWWWFGDDVFLWDHPEVSHTHHHKFIIILKSLIKITSTTQHAWQVSQQVAPYVDPYAVSHSDYSSVLPTLFTFVSETSVRNDSSKDHVYLESWRRLMQLSPIYVVLNRSRFPQICTTEVASAWHF